MSRSLSQKAVRSGWVQGIALAALWLLLWCIGILAEYTYHASIWFPPSGLTFAALLIIGWRVVPFLLVAAVISTFWTVFLYDTQISPAQTLLAGVKFGFAHMFAYAVGARILKYVADREDHRLPIIIIAFLIISAVTSLVTTVLVLTALVSSGLMPLDQVSEAWFAFWVGDMVALIVLAPLCASVLLSIYAKPAFQIAPLGFLKTKKPRRPFMYKLVVSSFFVVVVMALTARIDTLESAFMIFFLIIPQMWLTFSESTFRTVASLATLSFVIVLCLYVFNLQEYAFIYQFAIAIIATSAYFGVAIPLLAMDNELLRQRVMFDSLTNAASRDYLIQQVELEIARCLRGKRTMSLLVIDIDYFKTINDTLGHAQGDQALMQLSQAVKKILRGTDVLARFGGDEFIALLPDTDIQRAKLIAERIQQQVQQIRVGGDRSMTTSIGMAEFMPDDSFTSLFSRADRALYEAKAAGRNCIRQAISR